MRPIVRLQILGYQLEVFRLPANKKLIVNKNAKLNFGPGPKWKKPDNTWYSVDIDPKIGDIVFNFQRFDRLPLDDNCVSGVYGSHVFEHISIFKSQIVFNEIYRVLKENGILRLVLPDVEKSIKEYINGNNEFKLFQRRYERAKKLYDQEYTLFQCLKEDFLSPSGQSFLLGENALAHQNAWDYESIAKDLQIAGFQVERIKKMEYRKSQRDYFSFEGTFHSEANEDYRSLYVEAIK